MDDGGERNFLTTSVRVEDGRIFAVVGNATRRFEIEDVIDLVLVARTDRPSLTMIASAVVDHVIAGQFDFAAPSGTRLPEQSRRRTPPGTTFADPRVREKTMLIKEGESRTLKTDILLASSLAFVAGGVNSAGYLGFGYFSANMTGNVSLISDHISAGDIYLGVAFLGIVAMFMAGAFSASLFIQIGKRYGLPAIFALTLLAEAALLMGIGLYSLIAGSSVSGLGTVGVISFSMGIQNAASTRISGSRVRTTHVSGVATDIGVGLAQLIEPSDAHAGRHTRDRLLCYQAAGGAVFCAFSVVLLFLCVKYLIGVSHN